MFACGKSTICRRGATLLSAVAVCLVISYSALTQAQQFPVKIGSSGPLQSDTQREVLPYIEITGDGMYKHLEAITGFSRQSRDDGDLLWGRRAGSKYEKMTADYVASKFEEYGLEQVHQEPVVSDQNQWIPRENKLVLIGGSSSAAPSEDRLLGTVFTPFAAIPTPEGGLEAPIVDIGKGEPADLEGRDLSGKIVLMHVYPEWGAERHAGQEILPKILDEQKPLAVIMGIHQRGDPAIRYAVSGGTGSEKGTWANLSGSDATYLQQVIADSGEASPPRVRLTVQGDLQAGITSQNTYGFLPGRTDEYIIFVAHTDGWFEGATDNGSGVSALLGLAEHYSKSRKARRRRHMFFVATTGADADSIGVKSLIKDHPEFIYTTSLTVNLEQMGSVSPPEGSGYGDPYVETKHTMYVPSGHPLLDGIIKKSSRLFSLTASKRPRARYWGDMGPFDSVYMAMLSLIQESDDAFYWSKSEEDTLDKVKPGGLERAARALAKSVDEANKLTHSQITIPMSEAEMTR
jgi:hypothetical protein